MCTTSASALARVLHLCFWELPGPLRCVNEGVSVSILATCAVLIQASKLFEPSTLCPEQSDPPEVLAI